MKRNTRRPGGRQRRPLLGLRLRTWPRRRRRRRRHPDRRLRPRVHGAPLASPPGSRTPFSRYAPTAARFRRCARRRNPSCKSPARAHRLKVALGFGRPRGSFAGAASALLVSTIAPVANVSRSDEGGPRRRRSGRPELGAPPGAISSMRRLGDYRRDYLGRLRTPRQRAAVTPRRLCLTSRQGCRLP